MYNNDEQWLSHKYYVSYMIMQSNMTMMMFVIKTERWKLHGNISRNGYGNAMTGRYGGCFEEDIRWLMCNKVYYVAWFGYPSEVCTDPRGENGKCTVPKRLANMRW